MSKKSRIKVVLPSISSREEAEAVMNDLAMTANNQRRVTALRDAAVLAINQKFEAQLAACDQTLAAKTDALRVWAETNPGEFPKGRKSIAFLSGTLGFRTGTPALALLSRAWNWKKVTAAVERLLPNFIRNAPEVDKEAILSQRDELKEFLPACGIKVAQGESFFVEPKLTEVESRQTQEAA